MQALIDACAIDQLHARIELVISNKPHALILERARRHSLPAVCINEQQGLIVFETALSQLLHRYQINLLVLIGYMRILSPALVNEWPNKIINVHPSLLPFGAGIRDLVVHQTVLDQGHQISGCSVHSVTEEVDRGPILLQKQCSVEPNDTVETLKAKVQLLEGLALIEVINNIARC
jgi:phosphoribosylglycinamide formyltransferase-1